MNGDTEVLCIVKEKGYNMTIIKKGNISSTLKKIEEYIYVCEKCKSEIIKTTKTDVICEKCNEKMKLK